MHLLTVSCSANELHVNECISCRRALRAMEAQNETQVAGPVSGVSLLGIGLSQPQFSRCPLCSVV